MTTRLVFLVPAFSGFTSIGTTSYFEDVEQALGRALKRHGVEARVVRYMAQRSPRFRGASRTGSHGNE